MEKSNGTKDDVKVKKAQALEKILNFVSSTEIFPIQEDYDRYFSDAEQDSLLEDLNLKRDLRLFRTDNPKKARFAIFNITALREIRRREGKPAYITTIENSSWEHDNRLVFSPME